MIAIQAKIDSANLRRLFRTMEDMRNMTGKKMPVIIRQAMRFSVISAARATPPGDKAGKVSSLPQKYRIRPFEKIPESAGYFYQYTAKGTGKVGVLKFDRPLSRKSVSRRKKSDPTFKRLTKGVKCWNKKLKKWTYVPSAEAPDKKSRVRRIPYAGAAKAGWRKALRVLGNAKGGTGADLGMAETGPEITKTVIEPLMNEVENVVSYASKIAPWSASVGLRKGANRLRGFYLKQLERDMERRLKGAANA